MTLSERDVEDISFIGSGISCAYTILGVLDKLNQLDTSNTINITLIDKYPEFFCGIPYGKRSGNSVLLINSLRQFLPENERSLFISWIKENKKNLIEEFLFSGGKESKRWLSNNIKDIEKDLWDDLFMPRFFFGKFIIDKVKKAIKEAENKKLVKIKYIVSEVNDLQKEKNLFKIEISNNQSFYSKKVVLCLGSLPTNKIYTEKLILEENGFLLINDIYNEELDLNFNRIESFLLNRKEKETNVLIIGANASCLETIYKLYNKREVNKAIDNYIIISTNGQMPNSKINGAIKNSYYPKHLNNLQLENNLTAKEIKDAAFKDLELANEMDLGSGSTIDSISKALLSLVVKLNEKEKEIFACKYGNLIGRRQRIAGKHYLSVVDKLVNAKKLIHIAGKFSNAIQEDKFKYKLEYVDTKSQENITFQKEIHLIINCTGSANLENQNIPVLIKNLISNKYCIPNDSKIGFKVNDRFEASKNLYISGPLLAGNVIEGRALWHLEHCGRIIWSSKLLSEQLLKQINVF